MEPLHITIGSASVNNIVSGQISLDHDIRIVKAALLYADQVKLCSLNNLTAFLTLALHEPTARQKVDYVQYLLSTIPAPAAGRANLLQQFSTYRDLILQDHITSAERLWKLQFEIELDRLWQVAKCDIMERALQAGAGELLKVVQLGIVQLHDFENVWDAQEVFAEFVTTVGDAVSNGQTYPLFDDQTSTVVKAGVRKGIISASELAGVRSKQVRLAADLFRRLPLFEKASFDEIIDLRRELEKPLTTFRSAIIGYSGKIKGAAWDNDFPEEVEQILRSTIEPAVLEIEYAVAHNGYMGQLINVVKEPLVLAQNSALGLVLSQLSALPVLASQVLGIGVPGALLLGKAATEWREKKSKIEQNQLYFYYRAGQYMKGNRKRNKGKKSKAIGK